MTKRDGFAPPNYTQAPNLFYDEVLPDIDSLAELKVTDVIIRQTFGYHREEHELSLSKLKKLTGMSRQSVFDGLERGMQRGTIARRPKGQGFLYRLQIVQLLDQSDDESSPDSGPVPVQTLDQSNEPAGQRVRPEAVKDLDPIKERKKVKEKEKNMTDADAPPSSKSETDHQRLMREVYELVGSVDLPGAQGKSAKRMLAAHHSVEDIIACMHEQARELKPAGWRSSVSLMTVEKDIGSWKLGRRNGNGAAHVGKHHDDTSPTDENPFITDRERELSCRDRTPAENDELVKLLDQRLGERQGPTQQASQGARGI